MHGELCLADHLVRKLARHGSQRPFHRRSSLRRRPFRRSNGGVLPASSVAAEVAGEWIEVRYTGPWLVQEIV